MAVQFCPVASGSNGNSIYIGTEDTHILIDAGLSGKRIEAGLKSLDIDGAMIQAIFITHEHTDHILGAGVLSRRFDIPLYATEMTWEAMEKHKLIGKVPEKNKRYVYYEEDCVINDMKIHPFQIPHDAAQPAGYAVFAESYKIAVATDMGHASDGVKENIADSHILLLESNHDIEMLKSGPYPERLKRRILSDRGHLSNAGCGTLLTEIMSPKMRHVYLGHLSGENNHPVLAMETVRQILTGNHINCDKDVQLLLAERGMIGRRLCLE